MHCPQRHRRRRRDLVRFLLTAALPLAAISCASSRPPTPSSAPAELAADDRAPVGPGEPAPPGEAPAASAPGEPAASPPKRLRIETGKGSEETRLRDLCRRQAIGEEAGLEKSRRLLYETLCSAGLWFDGLLGGEPDVESARRIHGRLEGTLSHSDYWGTDFKARLRLRYDLPNLKHRFALFLGRDEADEAIEDRRETLPIQSALLGLDDEEEWLAGFGYSPPGRRGQKLDLRVGVKVKSETEVFFQTRWRTTVFIGEKSAWRFRETLFWQNRDGFGLTSSLDFNRVLRDDLLFRWSNIGTFSEATDGVRWRSSTILYQNLRQQRAMAYEGFVRGETRDPEPLREYGVRAIYRFPFKHRKWLFGELIAGWTFPRGDEDGDRASSPLIGFGVDLLFGPDPY